MGSASQQLELQRPVTGARRGLWFGVLGGALAWLIHLVGAYVIAEFGCVGRLRSVSFLEVTAVAWLLIAFSSLMLLIALASTWVAYQRYRHLRNSAAPGDEATNAIADLDRAGWITGGLFALVIFVESLPILYYLQDC